MAVTSDPGTALAGPARIAPADEPATTGGLPDRSTLGALEPPCPLNDADTRAALSEYPC